MTPPSCAAASAAWRLSVFNLGELVRIIAMFFIDENKKIGQVRAIAVKDYLKRIGLAGVPISIAVKGYGASDIETIAEFRKTRTLIELSCVTVYPVSIFEPQ